MYPELACREALVNAIAHRDYSVEGRGIEVRVYTDRLEIISPGGLMSAIKIEDLRSLRGVHQSRNSLTSRVLREVGYMRELGEGMRRIFELMKSNDLTPPDLVADNNIFSVTLHHKFIYTREQKLWLDAFETFNLSREQKTILLLGYNNHIISPKEIWDAVGIVDTEYYRQLIASLSELGIIERVTSKAAASNLAKKKKIPVKHVPRFAIRIPGANLAVTSPQASSAIIEDGTQKRTVESEAVDDKSEYARVYVSNLPYDINESALSEALSQYGAIADVAIPHDRVSHRNKGYGFVEFDDASDAAKAISDSSNVNLGGRRLSVRQAEPRSKPPIPRAASERRMEATLSTEPIKPRRPRRPR